MNSAQLPKERGSSQMTICAAAVFTDLISTLQNLGNALHIFKNTLHELKFRYKKFREREVIYFTRMLNNVSLQL
jgi:hypothetical protein